MPPDPAATPIPKPLDAHALRELGHRMVDFIADYWENIESFPVMCQAKPGEVRAKLPVDPPQRPDVGDYAPVMADLEKIILPGLTHWQHPGFHAFFPANISTPAVLGEILAAGLGVQGMLWQTSPACTELETHVLDWMADLLSLPATFKSSSPDGGGVMQSTASEGTLVALLAARQRVRALALGTPTLRVGSSSSSSSPSSASADKPLHFTLYASTQAHSSLVKAAMIAGLADSPEDRTHVRLVSTTADFAMDPTALERAIREDLAAGRSPCMVHATVGTTSSTAFDPLDQIAQVMRRTGISQRGAWLHADAAYAGAAMICPEFRHLQLGVELVDSYCFNPHKWLLTNFDCDCFYTRDRRSLVAALSVTPEYLRNQQSESGQVIDYRDWQIPLGRRFRALKLWLVIRHYGVEGLQAYIREHMRLTAVLLEQIKSDARFEICAPHPLNLVCFRLLVPGRSAEDLNKLNKALLDNLNAAGKVYLTHTVLPETMGPGKLVLRLCVGTTTTTEPHVRAAWEQVRVHAGALLV